MIAKAKFASALAEKARLSEADVLNRTRILTEAGMLPEGAAGRDGARAAIMTSDYAAMLLLAIMATPVAKDCASAAVSCANLNYADIRTLRQRMVEIIDDNKGTSFQRLFNKETISRITCFRKDGGVTVSIEGHKRVGDDSKHFVENYMTRKSMRPLRDILKGEDTPVSGTAFFFEGNIFTIVGQLLEPMSEEDRQKLRARVQTLAAEEEAEA